MNTASRPKDIDKLIGDVERFGVIGSPSSTAELALDILGSAVTRKLVGELAIFGFPQDETSHYALGQITEVQLRNIWHEDPTMRSLIRQRGRVDAISERQDTHLAKMVISAVFKKGSKVGYEPSILGTVPSTGTAIHQVNDDVLEEILRPYREQIFYLGHVYGSKPKLPLWFKHFGQGPDGAGRRRQRASGGVLGSLLIAASLALLIAGVSAAQEAGRRGDTQRVGRLIRISAPITFQTERRIKRIVDGLLADTKFRPGAGDQWPVLIFEIEPGQTNFGIALDLARYISSPKLSGITKVAFLPESISGHAVLVAIACDEIAMHPDATIGEAGISEQVIRPGTRSGYVETARETHSVPVDLVLGMLDPEVEVLAVETDVSREFVLGSRLEELKEEKTIGETRVLVPAGEAGVFTGRAGRELGFVRYLAKDRIAVAKALGLPREAVEDDPSDGGNWRPIRVDIKGPISARMVEQARSSIDGQVRERDVNFVCLWIDSPGGSPDGS